MSKKKQTNGINLMDNYEGLNEFRKQALNVVDSSKKGKLISNKDAVKRSIEREFKNKSFFR